MSKPTPVMEDALSEMRKAARFERWPGGFWGPPDAKWMGSHLSPSWATPTIQGLVRRGLAHYTEWKDGKKGPFPIEVQPLPEPPTQPSGTENE